MLPYGSSFLSRCARALQPGGWILAKESVAREANGFYVDRSDASITRTDRHFRRLFDAAGLRVAHAEMQPGLPRHTVREKVGLATLTKKPNGACPRPMLARPGPSWHEFGG